MKIPTFVVALVGAVAVKAQDPNYPADMPDCGETCGNNMFAKATERNCSSETDYTCLCDNPNFLYGVHDCSYQSCQNNTAANIADDWVNSFCASNSGTLTVATETGTYSGGNGTGATASTPTSTSVTVETITSGSSTYETTVSSTLYGGAVPVATTNSETTVTTQVVSTETSGGSSFTTVVGTSTFTSEETTSTTSVATSVTTETTTTSSSSSSTGAAAHITAGPVVGLLAAGLAAAFL